MLPGMVSGPRWPSLGAIAEALIGYKTMIVKTFDYDTKGSPKSWSKIMAMRHALTLYPDATYIWFLDQNAYIMDPTKSLEDQVLKPKKLESLMIKDYPVVPPDSIIKTFTHLKGQNAQLVISQDLDGLVADSLVLKNGDWAKFLVETWLGPLYRSYNFQKAERHTLVRGTPLLTWDIVTDLGYRNT